MLSTIREFIEAHEYCRALEVFALSAVEESQYLALRQELERAYEDLDRRTVAVTGIRFAERKQPN